MEISINNLGVFLDKEITWGWSNSWKNEGETNQILQNLNIFVL